MKSPVLLLLTLTSFGACGYKGGLYMPDSKPPAGKSRAVITPDAAPDRPVPAEAVPTPK